MKSVYLSLPKDLVLEDMRTPGNDAGLSDTGGTLAELYGDALVTILLLLGLTNEQI